MKNITYQELHILDLALRYLQRHLWDIPLRERDELGIGKRDVISTELPSVRALVLEEALRIVTDDKQA